MIQKDCGTAGIEEILDKWEPLQPRRPSSAHDLLPLNWPIMKPSDHIVQFYEQDAYLLETLSEYVRAGMEAGERCLVIATQEHRSALEDRLRDDGFDLAAAQFREC